MHSLRVFVFVAVNAAHIGGMFALTRWHSPWWILGLWVASAVPVAFLAARFVALGGDGLGGRTAGGTLNAPAVAAITRNGVPVGYIPIGPRPNSWTPFGPMMGDTPYRVGRKGVNPWFRPPGADVPGPSAAADDGGQDDGDQLGDGRPRGKRCGVCGIVHG